jgi:biopolymer transport protein ExbD
MPLRSDNSDEPQLNLTPLIDVVFLLIVFFMVGARFTEDADDQQFDIELPTAAPLQTLSRAPDALVIAVERSGRIAISGRELTLAELHEELRTAQANYADQAVLIRGDGEGLYQSIVDVMNACHASKIRKFSLAFQPLEPAGGSGAQP